MKKKLCQNAANKILGKVRKIISSFYKKLFKNVQVGGPIGPSSQDKVNPFAPMCTKEKLESKPLLVGFT